jgi:hypothetical protein
MSRSNRRVPPHNLDAEASVLGAMLISSAALDDVVAGDLGADDFYKPAHGFIFDAMRELASAGEPVDVITVADELRRTGLIEVVGGQEILLGLQHATPGVSNVGRYVKIVTGTARLRRLITVGADLAQLAADEPDDLASALDDCLTKIVAIRERLPTGNGRDGLVAIQLSTVTPERIRWLWYGRIPLGKVAVLDGLPDMGKSTIALDLSARVTVGAPMPDGTDGLEHPADVVLLSAEDGLADTVMPRVMAAGGDPSRVHVVAASRVGGVERWPELSRDIAALEDLINRVGARLVIVDVLMAYLDGRTTNSYRDQDMRAVLGPLAAMADRTGSAVLLLRHPTKAGSRDPILNGGGSIGIIGAARVGLLVSWHPDEDQIPEGQRRRLLAVAKCNIGPKADTMVYRLAGPADDAAHVVWDGTAPIHAADLLVEPVSREEAEARSEAESFILGQFDDTGTADAATVEKAARALGIPKTTLWRARKKLGITSEQRGFGGGWVWVLPLERQR